MVTTKKANNTTPYPNIQEFLDRHVNGGISESGQHYARIFTTIQDELLAHSGELVVVAQYEMPSHHRTEHPLRNTQIALIPEQCFLMVPPEHPTQFDILMDKTPLLQIPVIRYVSITYDRESGEYAARRHQKSINLTLGDIVSIDQLYSLGERGYGQNRCTIHIGNKEVELWLIPAGGSSCYNTRSFHSRICDATELLDIPGKQAMEALDHFFTCSFKTSCPKELDCFLKRNNLPHPK